MQPLRILDGRVLGDSLSAALSLIICAHPVSVHTEFYEPLCANRARNPLGVAVADLYRLTDVRTAANCVG